MAFYHLNVGNIQRSKGQSAISSLAYITASKITAKLNGKSLTYSYTKKEEKVLNTYFYQPKNSTFNNVIDCFESIENFEKNADAIILKTLEIALPHEVSLENNKKALINLCNKLFSDHCYNITICEKITNNKNKNYKNWHAHIDITTRKRVNDKWDKIKTKKAYECRNIKNNNDIKNFNNIKELNNWNNDPNNKNKQYERIPILDENGKQKLGRRNSKLWKRVNVVSTILERREQVKECRKIWAEEINKYLNVNNKIDERSYKDQGIELIPQIHEGYMARKLEKEGKKDVRITANAEIRKANAELIQGYEKAVRQTNEEIKTIEQTYGSEQEIIWKNESIKQSITESWESIIRRARELVKVKYDLIKKPIRSAGIKIKEAFSHGWVADYGKSSVFNLDLEEKINVKWSNPKDKRLFWNSKKYIFWHEFKLEQNNQKKLTIEKIKEDLDYQKPQSISSKDRLTKRVKSYANAKNDPIDRAKRAASVYSPNKNNRNWGAR